MKKNKDKSEKIQRRIPKRDTAHHTIALIYEATARIINTQGEGKLNTNHIAAVAGISVGTLYGYFSNKQEILIGLARREIELSLSEVITALEAYRLTPSGDIESLLRFVIRQLIDLYSRGGRARRYAIETMIACGQSKELSDNIQQMDAFLLDATHGFWSSTQTSFSPISAFIITRTIDCVVRLAVYEGQDFVKTTEFEDHLIGMIAGYYLQQASEKTKP